MGRQKLKKIMGSAHNLVLGFLGAHNPYTPIPNRLIFKVYRCKFHEC